MQIKIAMLSLIALTTTAVVMPAARGGGKIAQFQQAKNKLVEALAKGYLKMLQHALKNQTVKNSLQDMLFNRDIWLFGTQPGKGTRFLDAPPLYLACLIGFVEGIEELLNAGLTLTSRGKDYYSHFSPIHSLGRSRWEGDRSPEQLEAEVEILKRFISQDAVNERDGKSFTPLMTACHDGNVQSTKILLAAGADLEMRNKNGKNALFLAISGDPKVSPQGSVACVDILLKAGADVNAPGRQGVRPLGSAATLGRFDIMKRLLQEPGIDVNGCDSTIGYPPLHLAILSKNRACVGLLLADPRVNLFTRTVDGRMPMALAVEVGDEQIIDMLAEATRRYAAAVDCCDHVGLKKDSSDVDESELPEESEIVSGEEVFEELEPVEHVLLGRTKVLFDLIRVGDVEQVKFALLEAEIDPRLCDAQGITPLIYALSLEQTPAINDIKRLLCERIEFLNLLEIVKQGSN